MINVPTVTQDELVEQIKARLESKPHKPDYSDFSVAPLPAEPAAYALIVGAGFSYGVVPLVDELMRETIGGYYYPDLDQSSLKRPASVLRRDSASFWAELTEAAKREGLPTIELDAKGLPKNPGDAYQYLFIYQGANALFAQPQALEQQRESERNNGELFVKGVLRYLLLPGAEAGRGSPGRSELNVAHIYLAAYLEAQQLGQEWKRRAFCRTI
jgi:hypothetical protein